MTISEYRCWYEIVYCVPAPQTDQQLRAYPYYLDETEVAL